MKKRIFVGITGASGVILGIRLLEALKKNPSAEIHLVLSEAAAWNIAYETDWIISEVEGLADFVYPNNEIWAAPASGSFRLDATVICPCSMKTLAAIRSGFAENLITRAADVAIKERRTLILCPRETPLSAIHLDNMSYLAHLGVSIAPPMPAFYHRPATVDEVIAHHTMKVMDLLGLPFPDGMRWK